MTLGMGRGPWIVGTAYELAEARHSPGLILPPPPSIKSPDEVVCDPLLNQLCRSFGEDLWLNELEVYHFFLSHLRLIDG